jgi:hypothetical protein
MANNGNCWYFEVQAQLAFSPRAEDCSFGCMIMLLERFPAKWTPVRVKKTRQIKNLELRSDSIGTERAPA